MSSNHFTQIPIGASNLPATVNNPLGELDAAIGRFQSHTSYTSLTAWIQSLTLASGAIVGTVAANTATATVTVGANEADAFRAGARVWFTLSGASVAYGTVQSASGGTITLTAAPGGTITAGSLIGQLSESEFQAATAINYGGSAVPTLPSAISHLGADLYNAVAHGAVGDATTDDTAALLRAMGVKFSTADGAASSGAGTINVVDGSVFTVGRNLEISLANNTLQRLAVRALSGNQITLGVFDNHTTAATLSGNANSGALVVEKDNTTIVREGTLYLPQGVYKITRPIPFRRSLVGSRFKYDGGFSNGSVIQAASSGFAGTMVIDLEDTDGFLHMADVRLDANQVTGVACLGNVVAKDGPGSHYERVQFWNCKAGSYAVGMGATGGGGTGSLTGATFVNCHWNGCDQWVKTENVSDDVTFIGCRFNADGSSKPPTNEGYLNLNSTNICFLGCFFNLGDATDDRIMVLKSGHYAFRNCFFEEVSSLATGNVVRTIFRITDPSVTLHLDMVQTNLSSSTITALVRCPAQSGTRTDIRFSGLFNVTQAYQPKLLGILDGGYGVADYVTVHLAGVRGFTADPWYEIGGANHADGVLRIHGPHGKRLYNHAATSTGVKVIDVSGQVDEINLGYWKAPDRGAHHANPSVSQEMNVYNKGGKFVIQYNDGGTVRYKSLDLNGTGVTWVHSTTPP